MKDHLLEFHMNVVILMPMNRLPLFYLHAILIAASYKYELFYQIAEWLTITVLLLIASINLYFVGG